MFRSWLTLLAVMLMTSCATPSTVPAAARAELAPTGKLRAAVNLGNALFMTKDAASGELRGVSVDVMRRLAARLDVPLELILHASPGEVVDAVGSGTWDVAILAIEPARAQTIAFSPALTEIEATYVVHEDSTLRSVGEVDAAGIRIAVPEKAGYELYLSRTLRHATLIRTQGVMAAIDLFNSRRADVLAGLRPALLDSATRLAGGRILAGNFTTVNHGLGTPLGRAAAADYLRVFIAEMQAERFVARSIRQHAVQGLSAVE